MHSVKLKSGSEKDAQHTQQHPEGDTELMDEEGDKVELAGERVDTMGAARGPESTYHTALHHLDTTVSPSTHWLDNNI